jgi:hypothetical protein
MFASGRREVRSRNGAHYSPTTVTVNGKPTLFRKSEQTSSAPAIVRILAGVFVARVVCAKTKKTRVATLSRSLAVNWRVAGDGPCACASFSSAC